MSRKKTALMVLLILVVLLSVVLGLLWHGRHYVMVDAQFYPRGSEQLDLRGQDISIRHYEKLLRRLPECKIQWDVPFQGTSIPNDSRGITVSSLTEQDLRILEYLTRLETVDAQGCTDYEVLLKLQQQRPDLQVAYSVGLGKESYSAETEQIILDDIAAEDIPLLSYLPNLKTVLCSGGEAETLAQLKTYCQERQVEFALFLGGEAVSPDAQTIMVEDITDEQVALLQMLTDVKQIHLRMPQASAQKILKLQEDFPDAEISWEQEVCGQAFSSDVEEIDLSEEEISSLETLDRELAYFPDVNLVFLGECGLDNELLAAHREQVRDRYKLVWTVSCGDKLKTRTDALTFMPVREYVYYFNDEEAYNLRYCEDMVCIDIGHMSIHNIDFVKYMPNLEYLILAHTQLQYIDPISTCKKLKFLELDWSPVKDLTPLQGCTALEDLNVGKVYADFAPVEEMTWLKNLWMVECSSAARYRMPQVLPDTKVMVTGAATVANGWRNLENYYEMRDLLGMNYMSW